MIEKNYNENTTDNAPHNIKIAVNHLIKTAKEMEVPIFIAYKDPEKGYTYNGVFPEELDDPTMTAEYGKFTQFMKVCSDFNKSDFKMQVKLNEDSI